jgi:hypothetical protein
MGEEDDAVDNAPPAFPASELATPEADDAANARPRLPDADPPSPPAATRASFAQVSVDERLRAREVARRLGGDAYRFSERPTAGPPPRAAIMYDPVPDGSGVMRAPLSIKRGTLLGIRFAVTAEPLFAPANAPAQDGLDVRPADSASLMHRVATAPAANAMSAPFRPFIVEGWEVTEDGEAVEIEMRGCTSHGGHGAFEHQRNVAATAQDRSTCSRAAVPNIAALPASQARWWVPIATRQPGHQTDFGQPLRLSRPLSTGTFEPLTAWAGHAFRLIVPKNRLIPLFVGLFAA